MTPFSGPDIAKWQRFLCEVLTLETQLVLGVGYPPLPEYG